jgi:HK97 family phage portal protein
MGSHMSWLERVSALLSRKSSRGGAAVAAVGLAPARWTPRRYDRLAEEGYRRNVVAYRCVREVTRACASVPWLLDLLHRPNPRQSGPELVEAAIGHLLLSGNAFLEVVRPDDAPPRELYALRPDRMRVLPDVSGVPKAYRYEVEGRSVDWPVDPISGAADVLHLRDFHPLDDWYGLSPIEAAAQSIDQHNAAAEHNAALLQNGARPSGALVFRSDPGPDGIRRVEEALLDRTQGPRQAGRPLVLGGDVDWKELGLSPRDMDFAQMKAQAAREIAAAFGVPHLLVVAGEATYSNRADARLELWEHTVIPLLDRLSSALSSWLGPMFGPDLRLAHDLDEVPALAPRRRLKWQQIAQAPFLTANEKRQALGYQPLPGGGDLVDEHKNSENFHRVHGYPQPRNEHGKWDEPGAPSVSDEAVDLTNEESWDPATVQLAAGVESELYRLLRSIPLDNQAQQRALAQWLETADQAERNAAFQSLVLAPRTREELRPQVEPRGFATFEALRAYLGPPPAGFQYHHVIPAQQTPKWWPDSKDEFMRRHIHHTKNIALVPTIRHILISAEMGSNTPSGMRRRVVLDRYDLDLQNEYGEHLMRRWGVLK